MCCSAMEERKVPGRCLTQQRSGAEKVGQFEEDDDQFELHFFSVQTKSEIYIPSVYLAAWTPGDPKPVSCYIVFGACSHRKLG